MTAVVRKLLLRIRETGGTDWAIAVGGLAALITFLVHGLVDSTHHSEPISLWNMCITAAAALALPGNIEINRNWRSYFPVIIALAAAGMTWFSWWTLLPMHEGAARAAAGEWPAAAAKFEEAVQRDAGMAAAHQQAGLAKGVLAGGGNPGNLVQAISHYEAAAAIDPYWGLNHANLGALYRSAGRMEDAQSAFMRAKQLSPKCETYHLNLGVLLEEMGRLVEAQDSYFLVLSLKPDWAASAFWRATQYRSEVLEKWQAANPAEPEKELAALQAALQTRPDAFASYLPLIRVQIQKANISEAEKLISRAQFAAGSNALQIELQWQKAELAAARGDYGLAADAGQKILPAVTSYGIFGPGTPGNKIYNLYMFRRPAADIDFVPQMEVIDWPDEWGRRALMLADWMEVNGDLEEADRWRQMVKDQIPDLSQP
jgi:tetratricopeptide (TPR) repeat protein